MSEVAVEQKQLDCNCKYKERPCYECEYNEIQKFPPTLATDCIVVNSLVCSKKIFKIAEL